MGLVSGIAGLAMGGPSNQFKGINIPDPEQMKVQLQEYVQQGLLTPEDAQTIMQNPSEFNKITTDPVFKDAQMKALTGLQDVADQGGMTDVMKGRLNDIARSEQVKSRGAREGILQNASERGVGGSGLELMAQLKNQQDSATRASDRGTQVAADAEERALNALIKSGQMGGEMETQEFGEKSKIAEAQDAVNRFNTGNLNDTARANVEARNAAQAGTLAEKQGLSDANTGLRNNQQTYNKNVYQQKFNNDMAKATGSQGAENAAYNAKMGAVSGIEGGVADLAGGAYAAYTKNAAASAAEAAAKKKAQGGVGVS